MFPARLLQDVGYTSAPPVVPCEVVAALDGLERVEEALASNSPSIPDLCVSSESLDQVPGAAVFDLEQLLEGLPVVTLQNSCESCRMRETDLQNS